MPRASRLLAPLAILAMLGIPGCAALQQLAALRTVTFAFNNVSDVRLAGVRITTGSTFSSLGMRDAARIGAAVIAQQAPIELVAHVGATNPADNKVAARMVGMGWKLYIEDHQTLAGDLASPVEIAPGVTTDVPLSVRFDLFELGSGGARDVFELALAIAGESSKKKELRLELTPTIETSIGPIRYPAPVVVSRTFAAR